MERKLVSLQVMAAVTWEHDHRDLSAPVSALQSDGFLGVYGLCESLNAHSHARRG